MRKICEVERSVTEANAFD